MSKTLAITPRLSEKTYGLSENRVYVVSVPKTANKLSVKNAVEQQFEVKVAKVRIVNVNGKSKRVMSITGKRYSNAYGRQNDFKKAYVTLKEGFSLPFFAAIEEEEKQEEATQKKINKAMTKQAEKAEKATKKRRVFSRGSNNSKKDQVKDKKES